MRKMNKVQLTNRQPFDHCPPGPAAILGPGSTWGRVLKIIPRDRFSYVHGQCTEVSSIRVNKDNIKYKFYFVGFKIMTKV